MSQHSMIFLLLDHEPRDRISVFPAFLVFEFHRRHASYSFLTSGIWISGRLESQNNKFEVKRSDFEVEKQKRDDDVRIRRNFRNFISAVLPFSHFQTSLVNLFTFLSINDSSFDYPSSPFQFQFFFQLLQMLRYSLEKLYF